MMILSQCVHKQGSTVALQHNSLLGMNVPATCTGVITVVDIRYILYCIVLYCINALQ